MTQGENDELRETVGNVVRDDQLEVQAYVTSTVRWENEQYGR